MVEEKNLIKKFILFIKKYGIKKTTLLLIYKLPIYLDIFFQKISGISISNSYRKIRNFFINLSSNKKPKINYIVDKKFNLKFPDTISYQDELRYYLNKKQYFNEYLKDKKNPNKEYTDIKFGAYFQVFNQKKATFETLKSFRKYFPDSPVYLLSDAGEDFSAIAKFFSCDYEYSNENMAYWPCKNMHGWFKRLNNVCEKYSDCDWILLLEDDVRVCDKISKMPSGHMVGQGGGSNLKKGKQLSPKAKEYLLKLHPNLEINGISGCGASIFHRETFMECFKHIDKYNIDELREIDNGLTWATDFALTFLFLMNGKLVRRWLDHSDESVNNFGPASAFDHYYKKYYKNSLTDEDLKLLK